MTVEVFKLSFTLHITSCQKHTPDLINKCFIYEKNIFNIYNIIKKNKLTKKNFFFKIWSKPKLYYIL